MTNVDALSSFSRELDRVADSLTNVREAWPIPDSKVLEQCVKDLESARRSLRKLADAGVGNTISGPGEESGPLG